MHDTLKTPKWFLGPFKKFADISGRAGLAEFWTFTLINAVIITVLGWLDTLVYGRNGYLFSILYCLAAGVPFLTLLLRRLRDAGRSTYWVFLIPTVYGIIVLLFFLAGKSVSAGTEQVPAAGSENTGTESDWGEVKAIIALCCYGVTLYWLYSLGVELQRSKTPGWTQLGLIALPFLYLTTRLYTKRGKPWPDGSGTLLSLYASVMLMIAISYPYFGGLFRMSVEGADRGHLGTMRDKIKEYAAANMAPPADIRAVIPKPLVLRLPGTPHEPSGEIRTSTFTDTRDTGQWLYVSDGGKLYIDCTHASERGVPWSFF